MLIFNLMKYIVANWKQNLSLTEVQNWVDVFQKNYSQTPDKTVIVAGCFTHLSLISQSGLICSAQDVSAFIQGAHTARVGARQIRDVAQYCLVGHSEVRTELGDNDKTVALKVSNLLKEGIKPILCVDLPYLDTQVQALKHELLEIPSIIVAYEPIAAIGSGKPANPRVANEVAFKVKSLLGKATPVLYGGSVTNSDVASFTENEFIDGVLVGGSSLDPQEFISLVKNA